MNLSFKETRARFGQAMTTNPIPLLAPCYLVVRSDRRAWRLRRVRGIFVVRAGWLVGIRRGFVWTIGPSSPVKKSTRANFDPAGAIGNAVFSDDFDFINGLLGRCPRLLWYGPLARCGEDVYAAAPRWGILWYAPDGLLGFDVGSCGRSVLGRCPRLLWYGPLAWCGEDVYAAAPRRGNYYKSEHVG